jgi:predicted  nucleic acid-binding Zn-ribbon protein
MRTFGIPKVRIFCSVCMMRSNRHEPERNRLVLDVVNRVHYGYPSASQTKSEARFAATHGTHEEIAKQVYNLKATIASLNRVIAKEQQKLDDLESIDDVFEDIDPQDAQSLRDRIASLQESLSKVEQRLRPFKVGRANALRARDRLSRTPIE